MAISRRSLLASIALPALSQAPDPDRPAYHFLPPSNWMNDPNGPCYWKGEYHLFYQHNPKEAQWGPMYWGHAASKDMVHWRHLPIAMSPTPGGPDKDGVWSGSFVENHGQPTLIYTGVNPEVQCLATSQDMLTWTKRAEPVLTGPPAGYNTGFRDPCLWREDGSWRMAIGSGTRGKGGAVLLYRSENLTDWSFVGPLFEAPAPEQPRAGAKPGDGVAMGEMFECPDLFYLGAHRSMLYVSTQGKVFYWLGRYWKGKFTPDSPPRVLAEGPFYAPKSFLAPHKRRIIWGWIQETRSKEAQLKAGWSGVMSLPIEPFLHYEGSLGLRPAREVASFGKDGVFIDGSVKETYVDERRLIVERAYQRS